MTRFSSKPRGMSLIELMVAMGLSLVIVGAAAYLYLATRENQSKLDQAAGASEVGNYVLRLVGRDLGNAGFYPAAHAELALPNVLNGYTNVTGRPAYNQGIFGCDGAPFNFTTGTCDLPVPAPPGAPPPPDTLVIGYFTSDVFSGQGGQRQDCEGFDVALGTVNASRGGVAVAAAPLVAPTLPLFAANHYTLQSAAMATNASTTMTFEGRAVTTRSLLCKGLVSGAAADYSRIISGLDDFQVLYGVSGTPAAADQSPPVEFMSADLVDSEGTLDVDGVILAPWRRVVAVRVCVVSRTYESANAVSSGPQQWQDCAGVTQTATATDRSLRKTYTQVFSVRNHLNAAY